MLTCSEIFPIANANPLSTTYIEQRDLVNRVLGSLERDQSCLIVGPSKVGKTLLVQRLMARHIDNVDADMVKYSPHIHLHSDEITRLDVLDYRINQWLGQFDEDYQQSSCDHADTPSSLIVVIDDIHYLDIEFAKSLFQKIKRYIDQGYRFILIGVSTQKIADLLHLTRDFNGRLVKIGVPLWNVDDLEMIARNGFNEKKVSVRPLSRLAIESFGSPFVMQFLCKLCCEKYLTNDFTSSQGYILQLTQEQIQELLQIAGDSYPVYESIYNHLTNYDACKLDHIFKRHDGKKGNFNQILFYAIGGLYPLGSMPLQKVHVGRLRNRVLEVLAPDEVLPSVKEIASYIQYLDDYYRLTEDEFYHTDPVFSWTGHEFEITDMGLFLYLRNSKSVENTFFD